MKTAATLLAILLAFASLAAADEREAYDEVISQLRNDQLDAAVKRFEEAIQQYPDSLQLSGLHLTFYSYMSRAERHPEAARHAEAHVEFWLARLDTSPSQATRFSTMVQRMTDAFLAADQQDQAVEKLARIIGEVEALEGDGDQPELAGLAGELKARQAQLWKDLGQPERAAKELDLVEQQARAALEAAAGDLGRILALANILKIRAEGPGAPEEARAAHLDFLAEQARQQKNSLPVIVAFHTAKVSALNALTRGDAARAETELKAYEQFLNELAPDDSRVARYIQGTQRSLASLKRRIESSKLQQSLIGQHAFPLEADAWVNGEPLTDAQLKGKVVLLDFWAVWCGPCIATFPHLREWHDKYSEQGLVIIGATRYYQRYQWDDEAKKLARTSGLSPADEQDVVQRFARHYELKHRMMISPSGSDFSKKYHVTGIPTAVLIDQQGIVRMIRVGSGEANAHDLETMIKKLLDVPDEAAGD